MVLELSLGLGLVGCAGNEVSRPHRSRCHGCRFDAHGDLRGTTWENYGKTHPVCEPFYPLTSRNSHVACKHGLYFYPLVVIGLFCGKDLRKCGIWNILLASRSASRLTAETRWVRGSPCDKITRTGSGKGRSMIVVLPSGLGLLWKCLLHVCSL